MDFTVPASSSQPAASKSLLGPQNGASRPFANMRMSPETAHQRRHLQLQLLVLFPQHFHLPLLQRDGAPGQAAGQAHRRQQLRVLLEEIRMAGKVGGDGGGFHGHDGFRRMKAD
jgi:hypothetical protein